MTLFLSRAELDGLLTTAEVIRAVEEIHLDLGLGTMTQPAPAPWSAASATRSSCRWPRSPDRLGLAVVKLMSDIPGNRGTGLPPQRSTLLVSSTATGECLAVLDGAVVTRQRTAAASAVATAHLARSDSRTLGLVGAGALAVEHVQALIEVRAFEAVVVWTRSERTLLDFALACDELGLDLPLTRAESPRDVVAQSDVICTLTPSRTPIVRGSLVLTWPAHQRGRRAAAADPPRDRRRGHRQVRALRRQRRHLAGEVGRDPARHRRRRPAHRAHAPRARRRRRRTRPRTIRRGRDHFVQLRRHRCSGPGDRRTGHRTRTPHRTRHPPTTTGTQLREVTHATGRPA